MATIIKRKNKNGTDNVSIKFYLDGEQKIMSLGSYYLLSKVEDIKFFIDKIIPSIKTGEKLDRSTQIWLDDMKDDLRGRFIKAGLIEPPKTIPVGKLFDLYLRETADRKGKLRKDRTMSVYKVESKKFIRFFGADAMIDSITYDDCLQWRKWMTTDDAYKGGYAEATISTAVTRCFTVLDWAIEQGFIELNPLVGIESGSQVNPDRRHYLPMDDYYKLLDACPDQEWRTLLALCRIGGLRINSEALALCWGDIHWLDDEMLVRSPKTERYKGKDKRIVPLFYELRIEIEKLWVQAKNQGRKETDYVISQWRSYAYCKKYLVETIAFQAGVKYPKAFQNLRVSAANDIERKGGSNLESAWVGHSKEVMKAAYHTVTRDDVQKAIQPGAMFSRNE